MSKYDSVTQYTNTLEPFISSIMIRAYSIDGSPQVIEDCISELPQGIVSVSEDLPQFINSLNHIGTETFLFSNIFRVIALKGMGLGRTTKIS